MRLPDALALGSAMGWATFDVCDRMAARLVRVICEQEAELRQPFGWREGQDAAFWHARWMEAAEAREGNYRRYVEALHLVDDLVGQIEGERLVNLTLNHLLTKTRLERDNAIAERDAAHQEVAGLREQIAQAITEQCPFDEHFEPGLCPCIIFARIARGTVQ